jgi:hypothetical protein
MAVVSRLRGKNNKNKEGGTEIPKGVSPEAWLRAQGAPREGEAQWAR